MKRRKVLYAAHTSTGGAAFSLYHLAKNLDKDRYEPIVLFYTQKHSYIEKKLAESDIKTIILEKSLEPPSSSTQPVRHRDIGGWLTTRFGKWAGQAYAFIKACYKFIRHDVSKIWPIVRAIHENQIDLVHVNDGLPLSKPGIIAAWLTRVTCICHVRMFFKLNHFDKIFARFVDTFIYISRAIAEDNMAQGIPTAKGTIIHNAVDLGQFSLSHDTTKVRDEFGWTSRERLIGVIGRLDWWKGHEFFLEAMAEVYRQIPELRGLIVGAPETTPQNQAYLKKLKTLTQSLNLEDKVIFTGFRSDIPRLMAALDVVVLSSSTPEPFGRVVIEAMAAGKPVVATAAGGVLDIIEDGVNGLLVPCQDANAMGRAILCLLSNRELAERIGQAARRRAAEKFSVSRQVAVVQSLYNRFTDKAQNQVIPLEIAGK